MGTVKDDVGGLVDADRDLLDADVKRMPREGRRLRRGSAAAVFGATLTLPLAASGASAMPACACGGSAAPDAEADTDAPVEDTEAPTPPAHSAPPAPTYEPEPEPVVEPEPEVVDPKPMEHQALRPPDEPEPEPQPEPEPVVESEPEVVDPKPMEHQALRPPDFEPPESDAEEPEDPVTPRLPQRELYGVDSFTYHHLPPEDQQAIQESWEERLRGEEPPGPYGVDPYIYAHQPPEDQQAIRESWERREHQDDVADHAGCMPDNTVTFSSYTDRPCVFPDGSSTTVGDLGIWSEGASDDEDADDAPSLEDGERPTPGLGFPGSVSGTVSTGDVVPDPVIEVEAGLTGTVSEGSPVLGDDGVERTTSGVTTDLRATGGMSVDGRRGLGGGYSGYFGDSVSYEVTTESDRWEQIRAGEEAPPNPVDPRSLQTGDGIVMREEDYAGSELSANYYALQGSAGADEGTRVAAGVNKVDSDTMRIYVGEEDFVRTAARLGIGVDELSISFGSSDEFGTGDVRSVDVDISSEEGWNAYQRFVSEGELPGTLGDGVQDASEAEVANWSGSSSFEINAGPLAVGFSGSGYNGEVSESEHADGSRDLSYTSREGDVTLVEKTGTEADGAETEPEYALMLRNVHHSYMGSLTDLHGTARESEEDADVRLDFTESELEELRQQALTELQRGMEQAGRDMSLEEIEDEVRGDPYANVFSGWGPADDSLIRLMAASEHPRQVLGALHLTARGNSTEVADFLVRFQLTASRDPEDVLEEDAPGSVTVY